MPYRYLPDVVTADVAFEVEATSLEELFKDAADATMNVMVTAVNAIAENQELPFKLENDQLDLLLLNFLQELIFYKDAELLLLRVPEVKITPAGDGYQLEAVGKGERIDHNRHHLVVDVKAVTLHQLRVEKTSNGWRARVVLDI